MYTSDLVELVRSFGLLAHAYADDLQVYCHVNVGSELVMLQRFSECADSVSRWSPRINSCLIRRKLN